MISGIAGIVVALPTEGRSLIAPAPRLGECVRLDEHSLVCVCGTGVKRARHAVSVLVERGARGLVSWGCAGGLAPGLRAGDLCLPSTVLDARGEAFDAPAAWRLRAQEALASDFTVRTEPLLTVDRLVASAEEKVTLARTHGAIAVDMETAAVAAGARERRLPFLAIRAIADPSELPLPQALVRATGEAGTVGLARLFGLALLHPAEFAGIVRIARCFRAALRTLSAAAPRMGPGFLLDAGESGARDVKDRA